MDRWGSGLDRAIATLSIAGVFGEETEHLGSGMEPGMGLGLRMGMRYVWHGNGNGQWLAPAC